MKIYLLVNFPEQKAVDVDCLGDFGVEDVDCPGRGDVNRHFPPASGAGLLDTGSTFPLDSVQAQNTFSAHHCYIVILEQRA